MSTCPNCGTQLPTPTSSGDGVPPAHNHRTISAIFSHIPHPHFLHRKQNAPKSAQELQPSTSNPITRFNAWFALKVTDAVGTMWCAYAFAALALVSLPDAIHGGTAAFIAWLAQTFIQLVLLSIIIVGQKVASEASDKRAIDTYNDAEAVLHEAIQLQQHLAAQDAYLQQLVATLCDKQATEPASAPARGEPS